MRNAPRIGLRPIQIDGLPAILPRIAQGAELNPNGVVPLSGPFSSSWQGRFRKVCRRPDFRRFGLKSRASIRRWCYNRSVDGTVANLPTRPLANLILQAPDSPGSGFSRLRGHGPRKGTRERGAPWKVDIGIVGIVEIRRHKVTDICHLSHSFPRRSYGNRRCDR